MAFNFLQSLVDSGPSTSNQDDDDTFFIGNDNDNESDADFEIVGNIDEDSDSDNGSQDRSNVDLNLDPRADQGAWRWSSELHDIQIEEFVEPTGPVNGFTMFYNACRIYLEENDIWLNKL
ncbi:alpha-ketoglutarate-dependent dioxygenase alkb-like protein 2 [Plakobranchus ocellatus]|uniref:Alpha-ketoglutarate-dependent dioxygenase alkb-like protein 2 n=1 Tax=Plakobranchus ocellatus TaxID=259542 RepID=A0AAV4DQ86_9GAST|nr:alpha-ketoglutarate-dependent dioxygenase alkb-like protein 2 [Plakobranchus ocellatus]